MAAYGNSTCVPNPVNFIWLPVVFLQFLIVAAGCISHTVFLQLVVIGRRFGTYSRLTFGLISSQQLTMLLTSTGAFLITLAHGKLIEDCEISAIQLRKFLLYVHSFGEFFFVVSELMGTIERVTCTFYRKFRRSDMFFSVFFFALIAGAVASLGYIWCIRIAFDKTMFAIGFGTLTFMEVLNACLVFFLLHIAKKKYRTNKEASLNVRFEFSQSYAYSRCAAASVVARVMLLTYVYMKLAGFFDGALDSPFFYIMNVFINLYCLVYPWTIMLCHRKIQAQIRWKLEKAFPSLRQSKIREENQHGPLYTIDGKEMGAGSTDDHFNQLKHVWNIPSSPKIIIPQRQ